MLCTVRQGLGIECYLMFKALFICCSFRLICLALDSFICYLPLANNSVKIFSSIVILKETFLFQFSRSTGDVWPLASPKILLEQWSTRPETVLASPAPHTFDRREKRDLNLYSTCRPYKSTKETTTKEITANWMFIWNKNTRNINVRS